MSQHSQEKTRKRIDWMVEKLQGNVLDVGCSQALLPWLAAGKGHKTVGVDIDQEALGWAQEKLKGESEEKRALIKLIHQDFGYFESSDKYRTIVLAEYLEQLNAHEAERHLEKAISLLVPEGRIIITVPFGLNTHPDHKQTFFPAQLADLLGRFFQSVAMDVEDGFIRAICGLGQGQGRPLQSDLLKMTEKGIRQLQEGNASSDGLAHTEETKAASRAVEKSAKANESSAGKQTSASDKGRIDKKTVKKPAIKTEVKSPVEPPSDKPLIEQLAALGFTRPFAFDVNLFRALNSIYAQKRIIPAPRVRKTAALLSQADTRVDQLLSMLPSFKGLNVLEVGCGRGETSLRLAQKGECHVTGVDIISYPQWPERASENVSFVKQDITHDAPFPDSSFDFIFSYAVLEHVLEPLEMLSTMHRLLKPGGTILFTANLHRGPTASHRYREVFFPWPHLLFSDAVFRRYYREENLNVNGTPAWVNKTTHLHYLDRATKLGLKITVSYNKRDENLDFIECFMNELGKYPREDLQLDFIKMRLYKPLEKKESTRDEKSPPSG